MSCIKYPEQDADLCWMKFVNFEHHIKISSVPGNKFRTVC